MAENSSLSKEYGRSWVDFNVVEKTLVVIAACLAYSAVGYGCYAVSQYGLFLMASGSPTWAIVGFFLAGYAAVTALLIYGLTLMGAVDLMRQKKQVST